MDKEIECISKKDTKNKERNNENKSSLHIKYFPVFKLCSHVLHYHKKIITCMVHFHWLHNPLIAGVDFLSIVITIFKEGF